MNMTLEIINPFKIRCRIDYKCYAQLKVFPDEGLYLENIITDKKHRNNGLGRQLMNEMIETFKLAGNGYIKLEVHATDEWGLTSNQLQRWYESFGFVKIGNTNMILDLTKHSL